MSAHDILGLASMFSIFALVDAGIVIVAVHAILRPDRSKP